MEGFHAVQGETWSVEHCWQVAGERRMRRGSFVLQHLTALLAGLGAFLGLGFLNSGYCVRKHPFPPWGRKKTILLGLSMELYGLQKGFGAGPEKGCEIPASEAVLFDSTCFSVQGQG